MTASSRESLLESIQPQMRLDRAFFMKIYGYSITTPGFTVEALDRLKKAGCSRAEEYYNRFANEYEEQERQTMKEVAEWYRKQSERKDDVKVKKNDGKAVDESRTQKELLKLKLRLLKLKLQLLEQKKAVKEQQ